MPNNKIKLYRNENDEKENETKGNFCVNKTAE